MGSLAHDLRLIPLAVRQWLAMEMLELADRANQRAVVLDSDERYAGAVDLLAQQAQAYRVLARHLTEPSQAQTD